MSDLSHILESVKEAKAAANQERLSSPEIIQKTKAIRYSQGRIFAIIKRTLQREDPLEEPPEEEIDCYKIKLISEQIYTAWSASHGTYYVDDKRTYQALDYICILEHESGDDKKPTNETYWTCISLDAYIAGYPITKSLLQTIPWFQVNQVVEVIEQSDYNANGNEIDGTKKWRIKKTVIKTEELEGEVPYYSLYWNQGETRAMAVFK